MIDKASKSKACLIVPLLEYPQTHYQANQDLVKNQMGMMPGAKFQTDAAQILAELGYEVITIQVKPFCKAKALNQIKRIEKSIQVFVNLYDMLDEVYEAIPQYLEKRGTPFVGASLAFCNPNRMQMKVHCQIAGVPTSPYLFVHNEQDLQRYREVGDFPLFVKPDNGFGSVCISEQSIVWDFKQLEERVKYVWANFGGAMLERYIKGDEITMLVAGYKQDFLTFPAIKLKFPEGRTIISFEDKWNETISQFYKWRSVADDPALDDQLRKYAKALFTSMKGDSYARLDFRQDEKTKQIYFLQINSQCSMFEPDSQVSSECNMILRMAGSSKTEFMKYLLDKAFERSRDYREAHMYEIMHQTGKEYGMFARCDLQKDQKIFSAEMQSLTLLSSEQVDKMQVKSNAEAYVRHLWPIGEETYLSWGPNPGDWKPIKHSCNPNAYCRGLSVYALRDINKGEPLTIHYATLLGDDLPPFVCGCHEAECTKQIDASLARKPEFRAKWKGKFSSYVQQAK